MGKLTEEERQKKKKEEKEHIKEYWGKIKEKAMEHKIIHGDSRSMEKVEKNTIHHIVTSPPYYNAKEYSQWESVDAYLKDMKKTFEECFRVLKPGRRFCLNISDIPEKGPSGVRWIPLGAHLLDVVREIGFELADRIFWFKTPLKGFQYGSLPYPPSPLINDSVEYIFVLRKPGKPDYSYLNDNCREASKLKREDYKEYTKQIWSMRRVRKKDNIEGHIAPFPKELPRRTIKLYSFVGDTVLDPFGGRGTTSMMAMKLKRNSIIYEIKKKYAKMIQNNLYQQENLFTNDEFKMINRK